MNNTACFLGFLWLCLLADCTVNCCERSNHSHSGIKNLLEQCLCYLLSSYPPPIVNFYCIFLEISHLIYQTQYRAALGFLKMPAKLFGKLSWQIFSATYSEMHAVGLVVILHLRCDKLPVSIWLPFS